MKAASVLDYRERARRRLPPFLFEYIDGGSFAEVTLGRNCRDLEGLALRQRVLRDVSAIDTTTTLFGQNLALPLALAPVGLGGMNARRGEILAARAAGKAGVPFTLSTVSLCSIEEVAAATPKAFWFQLYMVRDHGFMRDMLVRAKAAGCTALVFTVDLPAPGTPVLRDGAEIGTMRSGRDGVGLAVLRLDAIGAKLSAAGVAVAARMPDWVKLAEPARG